MPKISSTSRVFRNVSLPKRTVNLTPGPGNREVRSNLLWAGAVVLAAVLEATWLTYFRIQGVLPNIVLVLVVYYAIAEGEERAMFTALLGGLFQDAAAGVSLGHHVLGLVVVGFVTGKLARRLITDNPAVKAGAVFAASLLHDAIFLFVQHALGADAHAIYVMSVGIIPRAFYTALSTPLVFFCFNFTTWGSLRSESR